MMRGGIVTCRLEAWPAFMWFDQVGWGKVARKTSPKGAER